MRRKRKIMFLAIAVLCGLTSWSAPVEASIIWDIYGDAVIDEAGDIYDRIRIYDTPAERTTVNMVGGRVHLMETFDTSMLDITAGTTYSFEVRDNSVATISGGDLSHISVWEHATVNFSGGAAVTSLGGRDSSTVNMTGGSTRYLRAGESATINLYGGTVSDSLNAWDSGTVNIYGYGFSYDPRGGAWDGGELTGFYLDDTFLSVDIYDTETFGHINLVPEPASILLLGIGLITIRREYHRRGCKF